MVTAEVERGYVENAVNGDLPRAREELQSAMRALKQIRVAQRLDLPLRLTFLGLVVLAAILLTRALRSSGVVLRKLRPAIAPWRAPCLGSIGLV